MTFDNIVLSPDCMNGVRIEMVDGNQVSTTGSSAKFPKQTWPYMLRKYTLPFDMMSRITRVYGGETHIGFQQFSDFVQLRGSTARAFLIWDPAHLYRANHNIGTGDGAATVFQLGYVLSDSAVSLPKRNILHPVPTGTAIPKQYQGDDTGGDESTAAATASVSLSLGAVWKIHIAGGPTGGKTTLHWNALNADVPYNATAAQVVAAFALLGIVAICTGGNLPGTDITIAVVTPTGVQTLPTWTDAFTGGTAPATTVSQVTAGKALAETTDYSMNALNGQITCVVAPAANQIVFMNHVWFYTCVSFQEVIDVTMDSVYFKFAAVLLENVFD